MKSLYIEQVTSCRYLRINVEENSKLDKESNDKLGKAESLYSKILSWT